MTVRKPTHLGGKVSLVLELFEGRRQQEGGEKEKCRPKQDVWDKGASFAAGGTDKFSVEVDTVLERRSSWQLLPLCIVKPDLAWTLGQRCYHCLRWAAESRCNTDLDTETIPVDVFWCQVHLVPHLQDFSRDVGRWRAVTSSTQSKSVFNRRNH